MESGVIKKKKTISKNMLCIKLHIQLCLHKIDDKRKIDDYT